MHGTKWDWPQKSVLEEFTATAHCEYKISHFYLRSKLNLFQWLTGMSRQIITISPRQAHWLSVSKVCERWLHWFYNDKASMFNCFYHINYTQLCFNQLPLLRCSNTLCWLQSRYTTPHKLLIQPFFLRHQFIFWVHRFMLPERYTDEEGIITWQSPKSLFNIWRCLYHVICYYIFEKFCKSYHGSESLRR